jgi:hypothetical protein
MNNSLQGIRTLGVYTAGRFDPWLLAGPRKASCRAHVMADLLGVQKCPQAKAGVTMIRAKVYEIAQANGVTFPPNSCEAERERLFRDWARSITA